MRILDDLPLGQPWPASRFPGYLSNATVRLRNRIVSQIGPDGAVREPCHSRVLESALALRILDRTGLEPKCRARVVRYLETRLDSSDSLDRILARAALGLSIPVTDEVLRRVLAESPSFTAARKRATIEAILVLLGAAPMTTEPDPNAFSTAGLHPWAAVQMTAVKTIFAAAAGRADDVCNKDRALLLSTQGMESIWESNILVHLSVLHALDRLHSGASVVAEGIRKVLSYQREDGGLPFISDTDTWCTATAGVALAAAGAPRATQRRLASHLVAQQRSNGGWSFTDAAGLNDADDISVVLEFLHTFDRERYSKSIKRGFGALCELRGPDGGFPTYVAGAPSEACMTAAAVGAFTVARQPYRQIIAAGLDFLAEAQRSDGSFEPDWSSSQLHTIFRSVLAASSDPRYQRMHVRRMIDRSLQLVRESQNADGGWGQQGGRASDAISTSYALIALCYQDDFTHAVRGVEYLLSNQQGDGRIVSIPDSIGPRPFVFTIPILADIFALLALGHLAWRMHIAYPADKTGSVKPEAA